jgi:hypothetical protein
MAHARNHFLADFEGRFLSDGERRIARFMFAGEIDADAVRLVQAPAALPFGAMVPWRRTIVFARWRARRDFAVAPIGEQGWFVHELAHVWQASHGVSLALAKLRALGPASYAYLAQSEAPFSSYNIEQQAEIARHLFLCRKGGPAPGAPPREILEAIWPISTK